MARNGKKTGGRDFKKGQSGNPNGMKPMDPEVKAFKKLTQEILDEIGFLVLDGNSEALGRIVKDPKSSTLKKWIASVALTGILNGDMDALDKLLNRVLGKVKEKVEHSGQITLEDMVAGSRKEK